MDTTLPTDPPDRAPSRRGLPSLATAAGAVTALGGLPASTASALAGNDPGREPLLITDATPCAGGLNDKLGAGGQFPYPREDFGSFTPLGRLTVDIPDHGISAVNDYRRGLDLAQGLVATSYVRSGVTYPRRREGRPTEARIRSVGGRTTTVSYGEMSRKISLKPGAATVLREFGR
ncbi:glycoside hydrolase N-terminal domain-containing protein [Streptomyces sp. NPDC056656]|uniref:glycoside hydrolase N-terminal domain-containing protein n=1 Tax=Streptomyces sp. NPDC056656 TaxID=3345895 RepID=UPI0036BFC63A